MTFCKAGRVQSGGIQVEAILIRIKLSLQTSQAFHICVQSHLPWDCKWPKHTKTKTVSQSSVFILLSKCTQLRRVSFKKLSGMGNPPLTQAEQQFETHFLSPGPLEKEQSIPMGQFGLLFEGPNSQQLFSPAAVSCTSRAPIYSCIYIFSVNNTPYHTCLVLRWLPWSMITPLAECRCHHTLSTCSVRAPVSPGSARKSYPTAMKSILPLGMPVQHRGPSRGSHPVTA